MIRLYEYQFLQSGTNGIDGYVRGSAATFHDPVNDATADWLTLVYPDGSAAASWLQIGQFQGTLGGSPYVMYSPTAMHLYAENMLCTGADYFAIDLGGPSTPNHPVYVYWTGGSSTRTCGAVSTYAFKTGSILNAPRVYGFLQSNWGYPEAAMENRYISTGSPEPIGTIRFGLNNNFVPPTSYGLRLYTRATGAWSLWSA